MMRRFSRVLMIIFCCFLGACSQEESSTSSADQPPTTPATTPAPPPGDPLPRNLELSPLRANAVIQSVATYNVAAGETQTLTADQLISQNGITIDGTVTLQGPGDRVELIAQQGDIILRGALRGEAPLTVTSRSHFFDRLLDIFFPNALAQAIIVQVASGRSILLEAQNGRILLGPGVELRAGNGANAPDVNVRDWRAEGLTGGRGGSIYLIARRGNIDIDLGTGNFPRYPTFFVGNGGIGGLLRISSTSCDIPGATSCLPPRVQSARFRSGDGGRSGDVWFVSDQVRLVNTPRDFNSGLLLDIQGGNGGGGGTIGWDSIGARTFFLETTLSEIEILTGDGGDGRLFGGGAGSLFAEIDVRSNLVGTSSADLRVVSGRGGEILAFTFPRTIYADPQGSSPAVGEIPQPTLTVVPRGGNGGFVRISGSHGKDGLSNDPVVNVAARNGGDAADLDITLGRGGHVLGNGVFFSSSDTARGNLARGGDGGHGGQQERIQSGNGGNGASGCNLDREFGGHGGSGGNIVIRGGRGGNAYVAGNGTSIEYERLSVRQVFVGNGGNGGAGRAGTDPATGAPTRGGGNAGGTGRVDTLNTQPGSGGQGPSPNGGRTGQIIGNPPIPTGNPPTVGGTCP